MEMKSEGGRERGREGEREGRFGGKGKVYAGETREERCAVIRTCVQ